MSKKELIKFGIKGIDAFQDNYKIFFDRLVRGYRSMMGKDPEGLDLLKVKMESRDKILENREKLLEEQEIINEKKLDRSKSLGILANIQAESNFKIGAVEEGSAINKGIGLFQFTFPTRKEGLLKKVPDYKTNWKGQIDNFLM